MNNHNVIKPPSRALFVGNIPYELTDEQVYQIMMSLGPVTKFHMVHDQKTNKSKGYCFVEYSTVEIATNAITTIRQIKIGNRSLRADFTKEFTGISVIPQSSQNQNNNNNGINNENINIPNMQMGFNPNMGRNQQNSNLLNNNDFNSNSSNFNGGGNQLNGMNKRGGKNNRWGNKKPLLPSHQSQQQQQQQQQQFPYQSKNSQGNQALENSNLTPSYQRTLRNFDPMSKILGKISPTQLLEFFTTIQPLVQNPDQVSSILQSHPDLAYASLQALMLMGFADANVLGTVTKNPNMPLNDIIALIKQNHPEAQASGVQVKEEPNNGFSQNVQHENKTQDFKNNRYQNNNEQYRSNSAGNNMKKNNFNNNNNNFSKKKGYGNDNNNNNFLQPVPIQQSPQTPANVPNDQAAMLSQILQLSDEQINSLPAEQQAIIRNLKASYTS